MIFFVAVTLFLAAAVYLLLLYPWVILDIKTIFKGLRLGLQVQTYLKKKVCFIDKYEEVAKKNPHRTSVIFEERKYTYGEMDKQMNKVANAAKNLGFKCNDCVAVFMYNSPEFLWTVLGLFKLGVPVAMLNYNLRSKSLQHCIAVSGAKAIICGPESELVDALDAVATDVKEELPSLEFLVNASSSSWDRKLPKHFQNFGDKFNAATETPVDKSDRLEKFHRHDPICFIYTSGTTGLPKAARVSNWRMYRGAIITHLLPGTIGSNDVIYSPLPLYHSAAFILSFGGAVWGECAFLTRKKFSASHFWDDCCRNQVTIVNYIGEVCRYLLAQPEKPELESNHKIRVAVGNGLRRDIWNLFQSRFHIPQIAEFYAATEGNVGFINVNNTFGSVGRCSPIFKPINPIAFLRYDFERDEPFRNENGRCEQVGPDESGLLVCKISKTTLFDGYHGKGKKVMNEKKLLHNVFQDRDTYCNMGDLLYYDSQYNIYFAERTGDTFRWKGENVSTMEVSDVLCQLDWIEDACVYGVSIPDCDGRAGMAAIKLVGSHTDLESQQLSQLYLQSQELLPAYAQPIFIRICTELDLTSTFKHKKITFVKEGFDPDLIKDTLYLKDVKQKTYNRLDETVFKEIIQNKIRL